MTSEELFRHTNQQAWFASAMPLLLTGYRTAVVQGLTLTVGSQVESVVSFQSFGSMRLLDRWPVSLEMNEP